MPTYGFRCTECQHEFEVTQSASAPPVESCEKCGAKVKKIFYPVGIAFKGSGFYVTDYKGAGKPASESGSETKTEAASAESKTETKAETKSDTVASSGSESASSTPAAASPTKSGD